MQLSEGLAKDSEIDLTPDDDLTLQVLVDMDITAHWEFIEGVCMRAEKEYRLEVGLQEMKNEWEEIVFEFMAYKETGTYVLKSTEDVATLLDDHIVKAQTMLGSSYVKPIMGITKKWENTLQYIQNLLDEWLAFSQLHSL